MARRVDDDHIAPLLGVARTVYSAVLIENRSLTGSRTTGGEDAGGCLCHAQLDVRRVLVPRLNPHARGESPGDLVRYDDVQLCRRRVKNRCWNAVEQHSYAAERGINEALRCNLCRHR